MALHRNIGYIREDDQMLYNDQMLATNGGGDIVLYPKDPIELFPPALDDAHYYNTTIPETEIATEVQIENVTAYARGIVFRDSDKAPVKCTAQLIDITTGVPVSSAQEIVAGHQFLIWTNTPEYRAILIKADGLKDVLIPFTEFERYYPSAMEIYLDEGSSNTMLMIAAAGAVFLFASKDRKKKSVGKVPLFKYWDGLPPIAKGILAVGGSVVVYSVVKKLLKDDPSDDEPKTAIDELKKLAAQGIIPTMSDTQFESMCQQLVNAASGWGTDEDAIYDVFEALQNKADLLKVIAIFGVREWEDIGVPFQLKRGSLSTLINGELNGSERADVNDILSAKGINFKF
jgi:hypothetical protein